MNKHDVFISYSSKDKTVADAVCHALEQNGLTCWIAPRDVQPGARYAAEIVRGIKDCRVMVLVYSKHSNQSEHVANEVDRGFNNNTTIIPFLVDDTPMNEEFDYYLARKHWLVAYPHYAEQLNNLAKAVANVLGVELKPLDSGQSGDGVNVYSETVGNNESDANETKIHEELPHLKLKADMDCVFYLDGEERAHLKAGVMQKLPLAPGEYELMFVSEVNASDRVEMDFEMPDVDKLLKVSLSTAKDSRLQKEAEARRLAEEKRQAEERRLAEEKRKAEEQRQAEMRRQEAERRAAEERKREEERRRREAEEQKRREEEERKRKEEEARAAVRQFAVCGVPFKMIRVEGGSFMMGSPENDSDAYGDEKPQHWVTLSDYYIGETPVTVAQFRVFINETGYQTDADKGGGSYIRNGSDWKKQNGVNWSYGVDGRKKSVLEDDHPVVHVSWNDAVAYCDWLKKKTGKQFALPTEAQWEFAARGGKKSKGFKYAGSNNVDEVAWYIDNSDIKTHSVKGKKANELGLYDMSGNVWEWCQDWKGAYSSGSQTDPTGPASGSYRVFRGGGWINGARLFRLSCRDCITPDRRSDYLGFRLALSE